MPKKEDKKIRDMSGLVCRAVPLGMPSTTDKEARTVDFVAATETPARVYDWDMGYVDEVLLMSGCKFPEQVPFLDAHSRWSVADVLGSFRSMRVDGSELIGTAFFAGDQASVDAFGKVADGHITDVSIGYRVNAYTNVKEGQSSVIDGKSYTGPIRVVTDFTVKEVSLAPIGADENAKARSLESVNTVEDNTMNEETRAFLVSIGMRADASPEEAKKFMDEYSKRTSAKDPDPVPAEPAAPADNSRTDAEAETKRCVDIMSVCRQFDVPAEKQEKYITEKRTVEAVKASILEGMRATDPQIHSGTHIFADEGDKKRSAVRDALLMRSGAKVEKPAAGASDLRGYTMPEICRMLTGAREGNKMEIVKRAMSSSDLPILLGNVADVFIMDTLQKATTTYKDWVGNAPNLTDLRAKKLARGILGGAANQMAEGAEYKFADFFEKAEVLVPVKYGAGFKITMEAMINDDLSVFTTVPASLALLADRAINKACYAALLSGKMADGKSVFDASHNNIATASAPTIASIGAAKKLMKKQTDFDGKTPLNLMPKFVLAPIELYDVFDSIVNTLTYRDANDAEMKNTAMSGITLITDGELDADNVKSWYMAADKGSAVVLAFLEGFETPQVSMEEGFKNDCINYKVKQYGGAKCNEYRTLVKNAGV